MYKLPYFRVKKFLDGWKVQGSDPMDNRRWYFNWYYEAVDYAAYLERNR